MITIGLHLSTQHIHKNGSSYRPQRNSGCFQKADRLRDCHRRCRSRYVNPTKKKISYSPYQDSKLKKNITTGIGLTAKSAEAGGISLIIIYNSGRFRMNGRGSLAGLMPYSNANDVVVEMASDVLPVVKHTPVIAGVCGSDPGRDMRRFLRQLKDLGFAGVQNFPTVGLIDGNFRQNLEETGMGYDTEVEMVRIAHEMDLVTTPYVFNTEEAKLMAEAGADVIVAHSKFRLLPLFVFCSAC